MSPEQARGMSGDVDTRSDVYSLGALIYELLTGTTVFERQRLQQVSIDEICRIVRYEDPPKPSLRILQTGQRASDIANLRGSDPARLSRLVSGDLDWIVMRALEKDRERRYDTASAVAADITRYLRHESVEAGPPSTAYRFWKFARRNRIALTTIALVMMSLLVGVVISVRQAIRAGRAEQLAEVRLKESQNHLQKVNQVVNKYFTTVSESRLLDVPGLQPLRKQLLESALEYYEGYAVEDVAQSGLQIDRIAAGLRASQVQFQLQHAPEGMALLDRSLQLLQDWQAKPFERPERMAQLAGLFQRGRNTTYFGPDPTDNAMATRLNSQTIVVWKSLVEHFPLVRGFQTDLGLLYTRLANNHQNVNRDPQAVECLLAGQQIWLRLLEQTPEDSECQAAMADTEELISILTAGKELQSAEVAMRSGLARREKALKSVPHSPEYRADLANSHRRMAGIFERLKQYPEGEAEFRKAIAGWKELVNEFPTTSGYRMSLRGTLNNFAGFLRNYKSKDEILPVLIETKDISLIQTADVRFESDPWAFFEWATGAREACFRLMYPLLEAGRQEEAEATFRQGAEMQAKVAAVMPAEFQIAHGYMWMCGWHANVQNRPDLAEDVCCKAILIFEGHIKIKPEDIVRVEFLADSYRALGRLVRLNGHPDQADAHYRHSIELMQQLLRITAIRYCHDQSFTLSTRTIY